MIAGEPRLTAITSPTGLVTRLVRDSKGSVSQIVDPGGGITKFERDARGAVVKMIDSGTRQVSFDPDEYGDVKAMSRLGGTCPATTRLVNDAAGITRQVVGVDGAATTAAGFS